MLFSRDFQSSRRRFLHGAAALLGASALPSPIAAQSTTLRRWEITDPQMPPRILESYKAGISKMLSLSPTHPHNWYRNALVHLFDCPHGNWWFLAWHRAYLGWLEATIRELSGDAAFALPYWDWTKSPRVPARMFDGVLDPNNGAFIDTLEAFRTRFEPAIDAVYSSFSQAQKSALARRPFPFSTPADLWSILPQVFFDRPNARGLTATNPDLDADTKVTVAVNTIRTALRTQSFAGRSSGDEPAGFQSAMADHHSAGSRQGVLESQPHNNVHGAMGGGNGAFMVSFYSPVDPIFFLHHANLDRLWDVWTRRQTALGRPALPQGADLAKWSDEEFLFFTDAQGQPVTKVKSGDYATTNAFNYQYSPASGEDEVPVTGTAIAAAPSQIFAGRIAPESTSPTAGGVVPVPAAALQPASGQAPAPITEITLDLDHGDVGRRFRVLVSPGGGAVPVEAGAITIFGHPHHGPMTFTVPLPADLGQLVAGAGTVPLEINVVPIGRAGPPVAAAPSRAVPRISAIKVRTG